MTYDQLADFIAHRMRLSHIDQPLLIRALLDSGGVATVRQIAQAFHAQDESPLLRLERHIEEMPVPALERHDVVRRDGERVTLTASNLTHEQRARLRSLCEQRMQELTDACDHDTGSYRLGAMVVLSDDLRHRVLEDAAGRCALCGTTVDASLLHVGRIIPRSRGGTSELVNLQALCAPCNLAKAKADERDFRLLPDDKDESCLFCRRREEWTTVENGSVWAHTDGHPVSDGHHLVLPKRHTGDFFTMTEQERRDANGLLRFLRAKLMAEDSTIEGFNVGMNCGAEAGQSVFHAHWHLIPRRKGDTKAKKGGVRGVIPERMHY